MSQSSISVSGRKISFVVQEIIGLFVFCSFKVMSTYKGWVKCTMRQILCVTDRPTRYSLTLIIAIIITLFTLCDPTISEVGCSGRREGGGGGDHRPSARTDEVRTLHPSRASLQISSLSSLAEDGHLKFDYFG